MIGAALRLSGKSQFLQSQEKVRRKGDYLRGWFPQTSISGDVRVTSGYFSISLHF